MKRSSVNDKMMDRQQYFEFIQVALGQKDCLTFVPTEEEWEEMFDISNRQVISGILYHAVELLSTRGLRPSRELLVTWYTVKEKIKKRNTLLDTYCIRLLDMLAQEDIRASILKGQGLLAYYDEELRQLRCSGDIDVYVNCGRKRAIAFVKGHVGGEVDWDYKHTHLDIWRNVEVELHYHVEILHNLFKNRKLQKWLQRHESQLFCEHDALVTPTIPMNLFYLLLHIYRHFISSGVGLRQLLDYYFVLRAANGDFGSFDGQSLADVLREFGMGKFAQGMMWVLQEVTGLDRHYMFCEPDEKEGRFVMQEILIAGNFGHYDTRIKQYNTTKAGVLKAMFQKSLRLFRAYPADSLWVPVWPVWHKAWKMVHSI